MSLFILSYTILLRCVSFPPFLYPDPQYFRMVIVENVPRNWWSWKHINSPQREYYPFFRTLNLFFSVTKFCSSICFNKYLSKPVSNKVIHSPFFSVEERKPYVLTPLMSRKESTTSLSGEDPWKDTWSLRIHSTEHELCECISSRHQRITPTLLE